MKRFVVAAAAASGVALFGLAAQPASTIHADVVVYASAIERLEHAPGVVDRAERLELPPVSTYLGLKPGTAGVVAWNLPVNVIRVTPARPSAQNGASGIELYLPPPPNPSDLPANEPARVVIDAGRVDEVIESLRALTTEFNKGAEPPFSKVEATYRDPTGLLVRTVALDSNGLVVQVAKDAECVVWTYVLAYDLQRTLGVARDRLETLKK